MKFFTENGIAAYFSGCLTLTLRKNEALKASQKDKYILCVDVPDDIYNAVRQQADYPVYRITKMYPFRGSSERFRAARAFLYLYHNASAVITSNLHTALPSLAFDTPVCLIDPHAGDDRFDGLIDFLVHCPAEAIVKGKYYDVNNPPKNPDAFKNIRDKLIDTCRNFTGYDSNAPTLGDAIDAECMTSLLRMTLIDDNLLNFVSGRKMLKAAVKKLMRKIFYRGQRADRITLIH